MTLPGSFLPPEPPAARNTDPTTSHEAAEAIEASGRRHAQRTRVLRAVRAYPGCTSAELAHRIDMDRYAVARRLPELEPVWIHKGDSRPCAIQGRRAVTWWLNIDEEENRDE